MPDVKTAEAKTLGAVLDPRSLEILSGTTWHADLCKEGPAPKVARP